MLNKTCPCVHFRVVYVFAHLYIFVLSKTMSIFTSSCCLHPCPSTHLRIVYVCPFPSEHFRAVYVRLCMFVLSTFMSICKFSCCLRQCPSVHFRVVYVHVHVRVCNLTIAMFMPESVPVPSLERKSQCRVLPAQYQ